MKNKKTKKSLRDRVERIKGWFGQAKSADSTTKVVASSEVKLELKEVTPPTRKVSSAASLYAAKDQATLAQCTKVIGLLSSRVSSEPEDIKGWLRKTVSNKEVNALMADYTMVDKDCSVYHLARHLKVMVCELPKGLISLENQHALIKLYGTGFNTCF